MMAAVFTSNSFSIDNGFIWKIEESIDFLYDNAMLSDVEKLKYLKFKNDRRKREWLAVRAGLNLYFKKKVEIKYLPSGQPVLENSAGVSITHSGDYIAVRWGSQKVGIDIEQISDKVVRVCHKFLNRDEVILSNNDKILLTIFWSVKEAVYKYCGQEGVDFSKDINIVSIDKDKGIVVVKSKFEKDVLLLNYNFIEDKYILAWVA